jgi:hypothetical protein
VSNHRDDEKRPAPSAPRREEDRQEGFAEALARSEFGRFYWNDSLERQLTEAMRHRPRPKASPAKR